MLVELEEAEGGVHETEEDPCANDDEDGKVSELVEPEEEALLTYIKLQCLLLPVLWTPILF